VVPFLSWVSQGAGVRRFEDLDVGLVRAYRAELATRPGGSTAGRSRPGPSSIPIVPY